MSLADNAAELAARPINITGDPSDRCTSCQAMTGTPHAIYCLITDRVHHDGARLTIHDALLSMMQDVRAIGKDGLYNQGGTRYNFRGVDAIINAVGPAARAHGVIPTITHIDRTYTDGATKAGGKMQECTVQVTWRLWGPAGDHRDVVSAGQAMDTSDKATSKALSVARRNMWLDTLLIPTEDKDPDADHIERGEVHRSAASYRDEILADGTSPGRLRQIGAELRAAGRFGEVCMDVDGESETTLGALGKRIAEDGEKP